MDQQTDKNSGWGKWMDEARGKLDKEEQAAYEKAMQEERERSAKWIADNMDEIKAFAQGTEKRDEAKLKRTRIIAIVLAAVLAILLIAAIRSYLT